MTNHIREIREQKGMTQQELANQSGVSAANISRFETGRRTPNLDHLQAIADALGVRLGVLFESDGSVYTKHLKPPDQTMVDRVLLALEKRKISAHRASIDAGMGPNTVAEWIKGDKQPRRSSLDKLSNTLGIDLSDSAALRLVREKAAKAGFSDNSGDAQSISPPEGVEFLLNAIAPGAKNPAGYRITSNTIGEFGLLRGDLAIIDLERVAGDGDLVLATISDPDTGAAETSVRRLFKGVAIGPIGGGAADQATDNGRVAILAPIVAVIRSPELVRRWS